MLCFPSDVLRRIRQKQKLVIIRGRIKLRTFRYVNDIQAAPSGKSDPQDALRLVSFFTLANTISGRDANKLSIHTNKTRAVFAGRFLEQMLCL